MNDEAQASTAIAFLEFWPWLKRHFNCIVRAGGPDFTIFDMPDVHWHFDEEPEEGLCIVGLYRAKTLCAELLIRPEDVVYVESRPEEEGHALFECIADGPDGHVPVYHFLMAHPMEADDAGTPRRWTH